MEGVLAAFAQFDNDCRSDRTRAGMKAALELGRWVFLAPLGYLNAPRAMGKSLMADPERAPLVRRAFQEYATGRYTKEQLLKQTSVWGLTNRRGRPLTSQAIGMLLRNRLYAGIVDVPEYRRPREAWGLRAADLGGLVLPRAGRAGRPRARHNAPATRAPGFPTARVRTLRVLWTRPHRQLVEGAGRLSPEMTLREGAAGTGLQIALELDSPLLVRKFDGDVELPWAVARGVGAAAGVVVGEAGADVRGVTDVEVWLRIGTLENVDESLVFRHARPEATAMPTADVSKLTECAPWPRDDRSFCDSARGRWRGFAQGAADRSCDRRVRLRRCAATARQPSPVRSSLACRAEALEMLNARTEVRLRPFGASARQPSHGS